MESLISEGEIKFRLHRCYMGMGQPTNAINVLQTIPSRQRTPACQMALGNLYRRAGMSEIFKYVIPYTGWPICFGKDLC